MRLRFPAASVALLSGVLAAAALLAAAPPARAVDAAYRRSMNTARFYLERGQAEQALAVYQRVLRKHPDDVPALVGQVRALARMERFARADSVLDAAVARIPGDTELLQARARLRRAEKRPLDAFADVLRVAATGESGTDWALAETRDLLRADLSATEARRAAEDAVGENPDAPGVTLVAALVTALDGKTEDGLRRIAAAETQRNLEGNLLARYAGELETLGLPEAALAAWRKAVDRARRASLRSRYRFQLADLLQRQGRYRDALDTLARIAEERKGTSTASRALLASAAIHQEHLDDPQGALAVYERLRDDPVVGHHRPKMLLQMADCYVRLGRFDEAAATYAAVVPEAVDPEDAETAAFHLGEVEFFRGDPDSAMILYQDMAETYPRSLLADDAAGRYVLLNKYQSVGAGVALRVLGRMEWGRAVGDSAVVDSTAHLLLNEWGKGELGEEALLALAELARGAGRPREALAHLERLSAEFPDDDRRAPEALLQQGDILLHDLNRPQEALLRYESVLTDYPNSLQAGPARRLVEALRRDLKS